MFKFLDRFKIQTKLLSIFGLIVVVGVSITGWTIISINNLDALARDLLATEAELAEALEIRNRLREAELDELSYVLTQDPEFLHEHAIHMNSVNLYLRNASIRAEEASFRNLLFELEAQKDEYEHHIDSITEHTLNGEWEEALEEGITSAALVESMILKVDEIIEILDPLSEDKAHQSQQQVRTSNIIGLSALLIFILLSGTTATIVSQQLVQPLVAIMAATKGVVEDDDFDISTIEPLAQREDEIGQLAKAFINTYEQVNDRHRHLERRADVLRRKIKFLKREEFI